MARPRNDLVERQKVLELLDVEIVKIAQVKRAARRFSLPWYRCAAGLVALQGRRKAVASMPGWTAPQRVRGAE